MKSLTRLLLIAGLAVAGSACRAPKAKENVVANALADSIHANPNARQDVATAATGTILQSKDGGLTWQDISGELPDNEQPEGFFANESDIYVHVKNVMYHSKSDSKTPVWERENVPDLKTRSNGGSSFTSIAFNRSGVMAFNPDGQIYQRASAENWMPIYTNFKNQGLRTIFETADRILFLGYDHGLYKSADKGQHWKLVQKGPVYSIVESGGVLMAIRGTGIMRSIDNGEHWEVIIREGRVGHSVELIDGGFIAVSDGSTIKPRTVRMSQDGGETWKAIDESLPPSLKISSIKQIGQNLIVGHPEGIFRSADMGKTWTRVYAAPEEFMDGNRFLKVSYGTQRLNVFKKMFTIYSSGNTFYAVVKRPGC